MNLPKTVSEDGWLVARKELLTKEEQASHTSAAAWRCIRSREFPSS
jgi:hypothetical protein